MTDRQSPIMHALLDSLCRCFGTPGVNQTADFDSLSQDPTHTKQVTPSTPDMKRRASRLALQDQQWDALFSDPVRDGHSFKKPKKVSKNRGTIEHAQAVAQAKLAANLRSSHKRKRSTSRDDIFRSKKPATDKRLPPPEEQGTCHPGAANPLSRFLSNHPVFANSLCFATPVRDSNEEDEEPSTVPMTNSVMSEGGCDETITSTLYYETTKLAALRPERNPPMPLFTDYSVDCADDIRIVMPSENSQKVWYIPNPGDQLSAMDLADDDHSPPPSPSGHDETPQLTCSTESSRESDR